MPTLTDFLPTPSAGFAGVWVRAINSITGISYVSSSVTDSNGNYSITAPAGQYYLSTGRTSAGPWTQTGEALYTITDPISQPWFNVKDYGAVGNGTTDDTAAIQAAITAAGVAGGVVFLPAGTYKVTASLVMKNEVILQGSGLYATLINFTGTGYLFDYTYSAILGVMWGLRDLRATVSSAGTGAILNGHDATHAIECDWRNLRFDGPGESHGGLIGIYVGALATSLIQNISVYAFETGWKIENSTVNVFERCRAFQFRYGFIWTGTGGCADVAILLDILGPTIGSDGFGAKIDCVNVQFVEPFFECGPQEGFVNPTTIKAQLWITANGGEFEQIGGSYSAPSAASPPVGLTVTKTVLADNVGGGGHRFIGVRGGLAALGLIAPISLGTASYPHAFIGNGANIDALIDAPSIANCGSHLPGTAEVSNLIVDGLLTMNSQAIKGNVGGNLYLDAVGATGATIFRYLNGLGVAASILSTGAVEAAGQLYPGAEALGQQVLGGVLHSTGVPSNANGNNNDWCISDNGHLYFKAGGAWAQKI